MTLTHDELPCNEHHFEYQTAPSAVMRQQGQGQGRAGAGAGAAGEGMTGMQGWCGAQSVAVIFRAIPAVRIRLNCAHPESP